MLATRDNDGRTFLIVTDQGVPAIDLEMIIQSYAPNAKVRRTARLREAQKAMAEGAVDVAVIGLRSAAEGDGNIAGTAFRKGARLVFLDSYRLPEEAREAQAEWVPAPFTEPAVHEALRRLDRRAR